MIRTIIGCARCHGLGHDDLEFHEFTFVSELPGGITATHWAMCPTVNEPILWVEMPLDSVPGKALAQQQPPRSGHARVGTGS